METSKSGNKKARITQIIIAIVAFTVAYFGAQKLFFKEDHLTKEMETFAAGINEKCPVKVDKYAVLDSVTVLDKNIFQYNYTLVDVVKAEVNLDTANKYIKPGLIDQAKTKPYLKPFRDQKVIFNHHYFDKNGEFITDIRITPEIYLSE